MALDNRTTQIRDLNDELRLSGPALNGRMVAMSQLGQEDKEKIIRGYGLQQPSTADRKATIPTGNTTSASSRSTTTSSRSTTTAYTRYTSPSIRRIRTP